MKRKLVGSLLVASILLSTQVFASNDFNNLNVEKSVNKTDYEVTPRVPMTIQRRIQRRYTRLSSAPDSFSHSEYVSGIYFAGTMYIESITPTIPAGGYLVMYRGTLYGNS